MDMPDSNTIFQAVIGACGYFFTRALAKFSDIKKQWNELSKNQILIEQSLKKAWEKIDKITGESHNKGN